LTQVTLHQASLPQASLQQASLPQVSLTQDATPTGYSARIPVLDGLRGIAILLVLLYHGLFSIHFASLPLVRLSPVAKLSGSGVDLFFVLSGFLIGGILLDVKDSPHYFKTFYVRRAYRILPLYLAVLGICLLRLISFHLFPAWFGNSQPKHIPFLSYVFFFQNIWMAVVGSFGLAFLSPTWSLAVEEQFYLTAPFLVRRLNRCTLTKVLLAVILASPLLRIGAHLAFRDGSLAALVLMPCRADAFCLGVLCALAFRTPAWWQRVNAKRAVILWATGGMATLLIWLAYNPRPFPGAMLTGGYTLVACFYSCCLVIALTSKGIARRFLSLEPLMSLGTIAYCSYLLHLLLIDACRSFFTTWFHSDSSRMQLSGGLVGIALTILIAIASWQFFESPLLRRGHSYHY
jgi:peptidoglycan/LPS O-acetylase OafA/YrhL